MAKFCSECGTQIQDGAKFCLNCGKAVEQPASQKSKCTSCSAELKATSKFCPKCGEPVASAVVPEQTEQQPAQAPVQEPQSPKCACCGAELKTTSKFCPKCGKTVSSPALRQAPYAQTQTQPNAQPVHQAAQPAVNQVVQPVRQAAQPVQQAVQDAAGQVAHPIQQSAGNLGGIANNINALPSAGEFALDMPGFSSVEEVTNRGLPGFVIPLITGAVSGGVSIPLLYQLPSPWPMLVGLFVSGLTVGGAIFIKKLTGGKSK